MRECRQELAALKSQHETETLTLTSQHKADTLALTSKFDALASILTTKVDTLASNGPKSKSDVTGEDSIAEGRRWLGYPPCRCKMPNCSQTSRNR